MRQLQRLSMSLFNCSGNQTTTANSSNLDPFLPLSAVPETQHLGGTIGGAAFANFILDLAKHMKPEAAFGEMPSTHFVIFKTKMNFYFYTFTVFEHKNSGLISDLNTKLILDIKSDFSKKVIFQNISCFKN